MPRILAILVGCFMLFGSVTAQEPTLIRMMAGAGYGIPPKEDTNPRSLARRAVFEEFQRQNPDIRVVNAGGLEITGDRAESMFLMAMAGATPPDVFYINFRQYYNYIDQGFCRPLDDLLATRPDLVKKINPIAKEVLVSFDGKMYAMPFFQVALGLYYRKDHFVEAGLDPNKPPRTWDELLQTARKLTEAHPERAAFAFSKPPGYHWSNFVYQAGGKIVEPGDGNKWKGAVSSEAGVKALDFFRRLTVEKWKDKNGKLVGPAAAIPPNFGQDVNGNKVSMWFSYTGDVLLNMQDLPPSVVGIAAMPRGPESASNEINAGMWAINANIKDPKKIEACWKFIQFFAGDESAKVSTDAFVSLGLGNLVSPVWLEKFGHTDVLASIDPEYVKANRTLFSAGHPEPYGRNTQQVYTVLSDALDRAILEPDTPSAKILAETQVEMDKKLLGYVAPEVMAVRRGWATGIFSMLALGLCIYFGSFIRRWNTRRISTDFKEPGLQPRHRKFFLMCLVPAVASLVVWSYYPLSRGLLIAFQDYRIIKGPQWVGFDNFINVFTQPLFYRALGNSFLFVGLSIAIGFFLPILLALALNEIPKGKVLFRTIFYLPAMTSPIVIAFLWRQFYDKADTGLLNTLVKPFVEGINNVFIRNPEHFWPTSYDWLGNPQLAMFAVVLPGIWAGAGPGSILYLAALKNIPEERYEAADMDGANWRHKIMHIVMPGLKPLILINLLGVFIGGFKSMETIFVLTMGGPLNATHVLGLEVWMNAFMYLNFGYATAAAWVMGAILIGFTVVQIRNLLKTRYSSAKL